MPSRRKHPQLSIERPREPIDAASAVAGSDQTATTTISGVVDHTPEGRLAGIDDAWTSEITIGSVC